MPKRIYCRHTGGGELRYAMGGRMHSMKPGDDGWVPEGVFVNNLDKLRKSEAPQTGPVTVPHRTAQVNESDAVQRDIEESDSSESSESDDEDSEFDLSWKGTPRWEREELEAKKKSELLELIDGFNLPVEGTGSKGSITKADLVEALKGRYKQE